MSNTTLEDSAKVGGQAKAKRAPSFPRALWHGHHGEWLGCLNELKALKRGEISEDLPPLFLSYYGHAVARCERDLQKAERLCREGLEVAFYRPEAHWNLASVLLCARDYENARRVIADGLTVDPGSELLQRLRRELEAKAGPPVGGAGSGRDWLSRALRWLRG